MVIIRNGQSGLNAVLRVEEDSKAVQEPAPIPIQNTVGKIATSWDLLERIRIVTQTPAVSKES